MEKLECPNCMHSLTGKRLVYQLACPSCKQVSELNAIKKFSLKKIKTLNRTTNQPILNYSYNHLPYFYCPSCESPQVNHQGVDNQIFTNCPYCEKVYTAKEIADFRTQQNIVEPIKFNNPDYHNADYYLPFYFNLKAEIETGENSYLLLLHKKPTTILTWISVASLTLISITFGILCITATINHPQIFLIFPYSIFVYLSYHLAKLLLSTIFPEKLEVVGTTLIYTPIWGEKVVIEAEEINFIRYDMIRNPEVKHVDYWGVIRIETNTDIPLSKNVFIAIAEHEAKWAIRIIQNYLNEN